MQSAGTLWKQARAVEPSPWTGLMLPCRVTCADVFISTRWLGGACGFVYFAENDCLCDIIYSYTKGQMGLCNVVFIVALPQHCFSFP